MQYQSTTQLIDFKLGYLINRISNLNFALGLIMRDHKSNINPLQTNYLYISIGTSITNKYYDF